MREINNNPEWIGKKFGRLTVVGFRKVKNGENHAWAWDCKCDCGNIVYGIRPRNVKSGQTASCGCLKKEQNKYKEAAVWEFRMNHLIQAILSTGDGKAPETAWYVISPVHEYNILNRLGLTGKDFVFVEPYYDYIEVDKNPLKIEGYYFNVHYILDTFDRKYRYEE